MSKYEPLLSHIKDNKKEEYKLTYDEINNILGFEIDHSFLKYKKELVNYIKISLKDKKIIFGKIK